MSAVVPSAGVAVQLGDPKAIEGHFSQIVSTLSENRVNICLCLRRFVFSLNQCTGFQAAETFPLLSSAIMVGLPTVHTLLGQPPGLVEPDTKVLFLKTIQQGNILEIILLE